VVEWRITELIEMADLLGVTVDKFLPKRRTPKPPDPMGEGRTSGLVVALPPVAHGGSPGVPPHPGADAFSLPATPPPPEFTVGIARYAVPARRDSRAPIERIEDIPAELRDLFITHVKASRHVADGDIKLQPVLANSLRSA
jgi:hypothetical protein